MTSFVSIIERWPSLGEFARDLQVPYVTAQLMKYRNSIAPRHWPRLVNMAQARGIDGVTFELLASLKASRPGKSEYQVA